MASKVPQRLRFLRVKDTKTVLSARPCAAELDAVLACWRQADVDAAKCASLVAALTKCAGAAAAVTAVRAPPKPSVNYILSRFFALRR